MKLGIFGGSFDPVHFGHLVAAQDAWEQHGLDRVVFVPGAQTPLKAQAAQASTEDRLAMLRAALAGDERFEISDCEINRGGVSYSWETARHFRETFPDARLFWIIGEDQLAQLPCWRKIAELADVVEFIVQTRPGVAQSAAPMPGLRLHRSRGHAIEVSSTELRARAQRGQRLDYFMPAVAADYVRKKQLYSGRGMASEDKAHG